jgi:hypothetical protein
MAFTLRTLAWRVGSGGEFRGPRLHDDPKCADVLHIRMCHWNRLARSLQHAIEMLASGEAAVFSTDPYDRKTATH